MTSFKCPTFSFGKVANVLSVVCVGYAICHAIFIYTSTVDNLVQAKKESIVTTATLVDGQAELVKTVNALTSKKLKHLYTDDDYVVVKDPDGTTVQLSVHKE